MRKYDSRIDEIENRCHNAGKVEIFTKAINIARDQGLKPGTRHFSGMVRRLVEWQEAGILIID